ncbi:MAG: D-tyrosyl-tRNA(Tyr) deacylase, partial [Peptococcaceae bacterium]|nr:D-tyrosyl-tRNA(Tyr) deacylase [Peptococcaceae bacterium]
VVNKLEQYGLHVATGCFGEHMVVEIINDGPVTLLLDSKKII